MFFTLYNIKFEKYLLFYSKNYQQLNENKFKKKFSSKSWFFTVCMLINLKKKSFRLQNSIFIDFSFEKWDFWQKNIVFGTNCFIFSIFGLTQWILVVGFAKNVIFGGFWLVLLLFSVPEIAKNHIFRITNHQNPMLQAENTANKNTSVKK